MDSQHYPSPVKQAVQHPHEHLYRAQVELGGGVFRGIQKGDASIGLDPLILFDGPRKSTLCLKPKQLTADAVRSAIAANERAFLEAEQRRQQEFERCAELAATRIFAQFAARQAA